MSVSNSWQQTANEAGRAAVATPRPSRLESYALAGLRRCWVSDSATWSHKYHLDGRVPPNMSLPPSNLYYSLNVLLGLSRLAPTAPQRGDAKDLLCSLVSAGEHVAVRDGFWGMALWVAACLDVDPPGAAAARVRALGQGLSTLSAWRAQDLGLALSGACAQARCDGAWTGCTHRLGQALLAQLTGPGPLFRDCASGLRRHVATFATQVYAVLALYHYGELTGDQAALEAANACVRRLIAAQGEHGEWPWFYAPASGRVLDVYEVYSVHQHGMAPAILHLAETHGVAGARDALIKGFLWIFGNNEMGVSMLRPDVCMIVRSQARRFPHGGRTVRLARAASRALTDRNAQLAGKQALVLTQEMRSYEFGWLLWSFAGRDDYRELTAHEAFADPAGAACEDTTKLSVAG